MKVQRVEMAVCPMSSPSDTSASDELFESGAMRPESAIAMVGKTEGTGLHDDFGRELAHLPSVNAWAITSSSIATRLP
jgi:cyanuric acid amidohydrolase